MSKKFQNLLGRNWDPNKLLFAKFGITNARNATNRSLKRLALSVQKTAAFRPRFSNIKGRTRAWDILIRKNNPAHNERGCFCRQRKIYA
jgi:hypothetical protein